MPTAGCSGQGASGSSAFSSARNRSVTFTFSIHNPFLGWLLLENRSCGCPLLEDPLPPVDSSTSLSSSPGCNSKDSPLVLYNVISWNALRYSRDSRLTIPSQFSARKWYKSNHFEDLTENTSLHPKGGPTNASGYSRGARLTLPSQFSLEIWCKSNDFKLAVETAPCIPRGGRLTLLGIPGGYDSRPQASFH